MVNIESENKRLIDVVDENDEIVDSKSRNEVHRLGLLHREVHVWMFDDDKNLFFQKRGLHRPSAGLLDATVGGHVNKGESYEEAAIRETKEETGLDITTKNLILLKKLSSFYGSGILSPVNNFFRCVYIYDKPVQEEAIHRESGIPGGGFQKLSLTYLENNNINAGMFDKFILSDEIPEILAFLK